METIVASSSVGRGNELATAVVTQLELEIPVGPPEPSPLPPSPAVVCRVAAVSSTQPSSTTDTVVTTNHGATTEGTATTTSSTATTATTTTTAAAAAAAATERKISSLLSPSSSCRNRKSACDCCCAAAVSASSSSSTQTEPVVVSDLVTVIVTTSVVKSNPSTEMIERVFANLKHASGLEECRILLVCDGCRVGGSYRPKKGAATVDQSEAYTEYKRRLKALCASPIAAAPWRSTEVVELEERVGFAHAVRYCIYHLVATPYVAVIQHDHIFRSDKPVPAAADILSFMEKGCRCNVDIAAGNASKSTTSTSTAADTAADTASAETTAAAMAAVTATTTANYVHLPMSTGYRHLNRCESDYHISVRKLAVQCSDGSRFVPMLFWYDATHFARVSSYRNLVFSADSIMHGGVPRGAFIEDTFGHALMDLLKDDFEGVWPTYGMYMYVPPGEEVGLVAHLDGRKYLDTSNRPTHWN